MLLSQQKSAESLWRLTFSNMASYLTKANQLVLIQRWARSNASSLASADGSLDKPGETDFSFFNNFRFWRVKKKHSFKELCVLMK